MIKIKDAENECVRTETTFIIHKTYYESNFYTEKCYCGNLKVHFKFISNHIERYICFAHCFLQSVNQEMRSLRMASIFKILEQVGRSTAVVS